MLSIESLLAPTWTRDGRLNVVSWRPRKKIIIIIISSCSSDDVYRNDIANQQRSAEAHDIVLWMSHGCNNYHLTRYVASWYSNATGYCPDKVSTDEELITRVLILEVIQLWPRYLNAIDRQTDRQTNGRLTVAIPRNSASRGKNTGCVVTNRNSWAGDLSFCRV